MGPRGLEGWRHLYVSYCTASSRRFEDLHPQGKVVATASCIRLATAALAMSIFLFGYREILDLCMRSHEVSRPS